jgi:uncharacterized protein
MFDHASPGSACVTGASSGIGEAFARALAARGTRLELVARNPERLAGLAGDLRRAHGRDCRVTPCDLTDRDAVAALARRLEAEPPDLLVNNAGFGRYGRFASTPVEPHLGLIDVNVRALVQLSHAFVRGALERGSGALLLVASTAGYAPVPFASTYAASKSFVIHFGEALWEELRGSGVHVVTLCPGFTRTRFAATAGMPDAAHWRRADSPAAVAASGLAALQRGAPTVVHGHVTHLAGTLGRILPRRLVLRVLGVWGRRGMRADSADGAGGAR